LGSILGYHSRIHSAVMDASGQAIALSLSLSNLEAERSRGDFKERQQAALPQLVREAESLRRAIYELLAALPSEVREASEKGTSLLRHLGWIQKRFNEHSPLSAAGDPVDIVRVDLPGVLAIFNDWYSRRSPIDSDLHERLAPYIAAGQLSAAERESWIVFKSRVVSTFGLPEDVDGHRLADALFGQPDVTANLLSSQQRVGYLNLFKGLYTLFRNPVAHNDIQANPEEIEAVIALLNSFLAQVERRKVVPMRPSPL